MGPVIWMTVLLGFASLSKRNTNTIGSSNSDNIICFFVTEHFCFTVSDCSPLQSCDDDHVPGKVNFSRLFSGESSAIANNSILNLREKSTSDEPEGFLADDAGVVLNATQKAQDITVYNLRQLSFTANLWSRRTHCNGRSNSLQKARCWGSSTILNIMWPRDVCGRLSSSASRGSRRMASSLPLHSCYYPQEPLDLESHLQQLHCHTYFSTPEGNVSHWNNTISYTVSWSDNCFTQYMELGIHGHVLVSSENEEAIPTISRNVSSEVIVRTIKKPDKTYTCTLYIEKHKYYFWSVLFSSLVQHKSQLSCEHYRIPDHILYTIFISCISYLLGTVSLFMVIADLFVMCVHRKTLHTKGKPLERTFVLRFFSQLFFIKWNLSNNRNTSTYTKIKYSQSEQSVDSCDVGKATKAQLLGEKVLKAFFDLPSARNRTDDKSKRELGAALEYEATDVHGCHYLGSSNCVSCREIITRNKKSCDSESKQDVDRNHPQQCFDSHYIDSEFGSEGTQRYFRKVRPQREIIVVSPAYRFLPDPTSNPAIDLAHVGYRLATLSAMPPSSPVWRLHLADAGFFFKGRDDELTCYSCGKSYSGWRRGDSPFEIHRRISPECQHVLQMASYLRQNRSEESGVAGQRAYPSASDRGQAEAQPRAQQNGVDEDRRSQLVSETQSPYQLQAPSEDCEYSPQQSTAQLSIPHVQETTTTTTTTFPGASSSSFSSSSVPAGPGRQETVLASQPRSDGNVTSAIQSSLGTSLTSGLATSNINLSQNSSTPSRVPTSASNATPSMTALSAQTQGNDASGRPSSPARAASTAWREDSPNDDNSSSAAKADSRSLFPRAGLDLGGAVYPMYQDMQSRRRTFTLWDDRKAPPLDQIILSGMFYAGYADCVRCFYCGVGLKHWLVTDDVMAEHVRWRPGCQYLRAIKGDDYIRETLNRLDLQNSATSQSEGVDNIATSSTSPGSTATSGTTATTASSSTFTSTASAPSSASPLLRTSTSPSALAAASTTTGASASTSSSLPRRIPFSAATRTASPATGNASTQSAAGGAINRTTVVSNAAEETETVVQLQEENRALENSFRCRVCQEAEIDTILMPCGHLVTCETCARSVTSCPLCHETIRATARVHLS